ncbi:MAG: LLM class flavin-dependent oxidoreductase, partial [Mesorhizobium sp.]
DGQRIRAVPGEGEQVPIWILGSSLYGAQLAAMLGLPYAFASHFAPAELDHALEIYRSRFQPSKQLDKPYVMLGLNVFAAPSDAEARLLFTSLQQAFVNLRTGRPGRLPSPVEGY